MSDFEVTVCVTRYVRLAVKAATAKEAREQIEDYGLTQAVSDYKVVEETQYERIARSRRAI